MPAQGWGFSEGKFNDEVLLTGSPWNSISSCIESADELKKYLNVLQGKKAWNSRNSLSLATTISKGNPGTASLWRRILEIFSEPRSNKEQKWVFVMSTSSSVFYLAFEWESLLSSICCFAEWSWKILSAPHTVQKTYLCKNPWARVRSADDQPPILISNLREQKSGRKPIITRNNINTYWFFILHLFEVQEWIFLSYPRKPHKHLIKKLFPEKHSYFSESLRHWVPEEHHQCFILISGDFLGPIITTHWGY